MLELLVVLVIFLVLMVMVYGSFSGVSSRDRLVAETNRLVGLVNATRTRSLTDGGPWNRLVFYTDAASGDRWWVDQVRPKTPAMPQDVDVRVSNPDVFVPWAIETHVLDKGVRIESVFVNNFDTASTYTLQDGSGVAVRFAREGTADEALVTLVTTSEPVLRSQVRIVSGTAKPLVEVLP